MTDRVFIQISGPEHSGKTTITALLARFLEEQGATVVLQRGDPQLEDKLAAGPDDLKSRLGTVEIILTEMQTARPKA